MIVLDTDHVTALKYSEHPRSRPLVARLEARPTGERIALSIISVEEQMRGWLAAIAKERQPRRQITAYWELQRLFDYFQWFEIIPFDESCVDQFDRLRAAKLRLGTMDLKIASTALAHRAVLLSANLRDFERVPGLQVENWLD